MSCHLQVLLLHVSTEEELNRSAAMGAFCFEGTLFGFMCEGKPKKTIRIQLLDPQDDGFILVALQTNPKTSHSHLETHPKLRPSQRTGLHNFSMESEKAFHLQSSKQLKSPHAMVKAHITMWFP